MELLIATFGLLFIGFAVLCNHKYKKYKIKVFDKKLLDTLPFVICTVQHNKFKYQNEAARTLLPSFEKIKKLNSSIDFTQSYQLIEDLYLDDDQSKSLKCYIFWENEILYCVGIYKLLKQKQSSNAVRLVNNYVMLNDNLKIDITTILKYAGTLLGSDWVCFYHKVKDECIEVAEYWKKPATKLQHKDCDKIKYFQYHPELNERYSILHRKDVTNPKIGKEWDDAGIKHKILAPVMYNNEIYGIVSFSIYDEKLRQIESGITQVIITIVNFIIEIQIKIKNDLEYQKALDKIQKALAEYIKTQAQHSKEMYERELYSYQVMSGPKDDDLYNEENVKPETDKPNNFKNSNWSFRGMYGRRYPSSRSVNK